ncbi:MAG: LL-diaminopimelate aminotransferase [Rhodospirillales bacterium]|jgi:LL-diaminopimelate aminotransferase|nr:LL-diaminopimelate aminotransferase [Rhodospirillales bacterium]
MDIIVAERLGGKQFGKSTEIYKFEKIKRAKDAAAKKFPNIPIIDMGVGEPDAPADPKIVEVLAAEAGRAENRFYADNGIAPFQEAAARYMEQVYGVGGLDPAEQIVHGIGSKPIFAMLPLCLINPGDVLLTAVPGYPVMATYTRYVGGQVHPLPLLEENGFLPDLGAIPADVLGKAKAIYVNYPNNPTGTVATPEFYRELVDFAHKHGIVIVQDAAYGALTYDGHKPMSILSTDGAMEVAVEVHSLSKAFNMTGWRLAFLTGNSKVVKAYATVKDNTDSGQFRAIQKAGMFALAHPEITARTCEKYSRRFDLLVEALNDVGFSVKKSPATFYLYVACPKGTASGVTFENAAQFSEFLIMEAQISTVPWDDAGAYVRFSVTFEADGPEAEKKIIDEVRERLGRLKLVF